MFAFLLYFPYFCGINMRRLLTLIIALFALATMAQTLHFHQLTVKDGLLHNAITTLAEDGKGNIWVATHGGLLSYDGMQFTTIPIDELPDRRVDRINRAADGTMWVQCFERHQQVSRYDTVTHHFVTYNVSDLSDSLRQQAVQPLNRTFADTRTSRVWTIEKRQLLQLDTLRPNTQTTYIGKTATDAGLKDETFYSLLLDQQGILWAGSANNGLFYADTRQSYYRRLMCQPNPIVRATFKDSKGILWIAIGDQQLLNVSKGSNITNHVVYPMTDSIEGRRVRDIVEDSKGRLWIGTRDGLYKKEAASTDIQRVPIAKDTLVSVFCLCIDKKGHLWMGTDQGLFCLSLDDRQLQVEHVDSIPTLIGKIAADDNHLWIATENGLYCRADNKTTQWYQEATHAIVTDARGQMWVGTDNGLLRITEQGVQHVKTAVDGHIVKDLICWRDFLWCSHEQGLCCVNIYTGRSTILRTEHNEYLDGSACVDASTGTLYFGGTMGIDCIDADKLDEKLRSGITQLWMEEISEELKEKSEEPASPTWYYWLMGLLISGTLAYLYFIKRKQKKTPTETEQLLPKESIPEQSLIPDVPSPIRNLSPFILKATAIAEVHIADADFTAEQMAQELAMSRTKLFMLMKKETGKAVMEFVRDIRLEHAAEMLKNDIPVADITMACGFSDPSSFRRSFAKKYGVNPSQYRSKHKT